MRFSVLFAGLAIAAFAAPWGRQAMAQTVPADQGATEIQTIVVTATRVEQPSFDLPVSIDSVGPDALHDGQMQVNLSESLARVPGIIVQNRQNYAQDLQISARGFGSHATFGVRGMRIYVDGIPASQPDGQGQVSNIDLGSAERIEVLRGPFSALYGNAAGGVISVFTEDGKPGSAIDGSFEYGSFNTQRYALKASGDQDGFNYVAEAANFRTDGYREHSAAWRGTYNTKLRFTLADDLQLTLIANALDLSAQDALGLTRAQYDTNPVQAGTGADSFNTRKTVNQEQFGVAYKRDVGDNDSLNAIVYGGNRSVRQFQAIPLTTQAPASSPGGVIDLSNGYWGGDVHWTDHRDVAGMALQVTAGVSYDGLDEGRKGYQNFIGAVTGILGPLRRNETDDVAEFDQYIQLQLEPDTHWLLEAGIRNSRVHITSYDHYIVPGNGDDSGDATYHATTPVAGITYRINPSINVYASYGKGFQTPTLDELAYRSTGGTLTGLNLALRPSRSDNYEIGVKTYVTEAIRLNLAAFHIDTTDELAIQANTGGRSVYQNVGRTNRDGVEAGLTGQWSNGIGLSVAYTYLRATYGSNFTTCPALPCVPLVVPAGNRLPGVPLNALYSELSWHDASTGFSVALEGRAEARVFVNDPNTDAAPFYVTANVRTGFVQEFGSWHLKEFLRVDNLTDRKYAGSVIVNESNGRFFEPAPGRTAYAGIDARYDW